MEPVDDELTIRVPRALKLRLEGQAATRDMTVGALVRAAIEEAEALWAGTAGAHGSSARGGSAGAALRPPVQPAPPPLVAGAPVDVWRPGWRPEAPAAFAAPAAPPKTAPPMTHPAPAPVRATQPIAMPAPGARLAARAVAARTAAVLAQPIADGPIFVAPAPQTAMRPADRPNA